MYEDKYNVINVKYKYVDGAINTVEINALNKYIFAIETILYYKKNKNL